VAGHIKNGLKGVDYRAQLGGLIGKKKTKREHEIVKISLRVTKKTNLRVNHLIHNFSLGLYYSL